MYKRLFSVSALALFLAAAPAFGDILWFTDLDLGTNVIPGAIALAGKTGVQAVDLNDFNTQLTAGGWELVIFGEHNFFLFDDGTTGVNLTSWVAGGGRLIGATFWSASGFAALMEASADGSNDSLITTDGHPIFNGLGATIDIIDPGWSIFSQSYNPTGAGTGLGALGTASAVILGNGGRTLLNGPLFDTYGDVGQGQQFVANEIGFLLGAEVPEPGTWGLLASGLVGLVAFRRRR